ncbi:maltoporin LamB [Echinimonas agarilytica]|uniref:Maltoporin LamB n=1 Tax=Echinimonas agarilytica TaxID=1215918 RepID=A0AA42B6V8_9GAMM|nr:maltoporin LamB [Echinimonas agarilytica]MCM2679120.1 maltoporin LamB [Echinimonas agarilytica]
MTNIKALAAAVSAVLLTASATAVEFHGYARAGLSSTGDGGEQSCYGSGGAGHLAGRLADECDTYVELDFQQELYNQGGKKFRVEFMPVFTSENDFQGNSAQWNSTYQNPADEDRVEAWRGGDWSMRQAYVAADGILNFAPEASLWAGKRFYQRKDIHIMDWYYLNNSGYGVGIENVEMGAGKLSVAWINMDQHVGDGSEDKDEQGRYQNIVQSNKLDIRYAGIELWEGASLELAAIYGWADLTDYQDDAGYDDEDGYFLTAEISHGLMGGFNKIVVQYAADSMGDSAYDNHGGESSLSTPWWGGSKESSFRVIDWGVVNLSETIELGYSFMYAAAETFDSELAEDEPTRISAVLRPMYKWDDVMKTTLELGYTKEDDVGSGESVDLSKIVVAQEWSAGPSFWSRPTIRVYAGSFFGDAAENRDDDGNLRFGAQMEAWW